MTLGCSKDSDDPVTVNVSDTENVVTRGLKVDVCHLGDDGNWHVINVSINALPVHLAHGDVQLIDEDGDGWVTLANECGLPVDCDDTNPALTDNCVPDCCFDLALEELNLTCWNGDPSNPILYDENPIYGLCSNCLPNCGYNTPNLGLFQAVSPAPEECRLYLVQLANDLGLGIGPNCSSFNSNNDKTVIFGQQSN